MPIVKGTNILVVEDNYFLATELGRYFSALGASVMGPVPSVDAAHAFLDETEAAILDIRLDDGNVFTLADELLRRRVPFVFYTAYPETAIPARFQHVGYLQKPAQPESVVKTLFEHQEVDRSSPENSGGSVMTALPLLRLAARVQIGDEKAADRLVEETLKRAIREAGSQPPDTTVQEWLSRLLLVVFEEQGTKLMN